MSSIGRRQSQIGAQKPSAVPGFVLARVGLPRSPLQFVMPEVANQGGEAAIRGVGSAGVDFLRQQILRHAGFGARPVQFISSSELVDEKFPVTGDMNTEAYFTKLLSSQMSYTAASGSSELNENPPPGEPVPQGDAPAAVVSKDKRRSKNFSTEEDKLLVSAWLNVSLDAVKGADQTRSTYWKRIHDYFH